METIAEKFHKIHDRGRPFISTCLYGLVASLAAVGFQLLINWLYDFCYKSRAGYGFWQFAGITLAVMTVSSLAPEWLLNSFCPQAAGSGIPQVKLAFWKEYGFSCAASRGLNLSQTLGTDYLNVMARDFVK